MKKKDNSNDIISISKQIRCSIFLFAFCLFLSCNVNNKSFFVNTETFDFNDLETSMLEGVVLKFNDTIWNPVDITLKDTLLFLKNRSAEYIYDIYNLNNNTKINECFNIGQGPNDFIFPLIVQSMDTNVWIYDKDLAKLNEYKVSNLLVSKAPLSIKNIIFKKNSSTNVAVLSDGTILASVNLLPRGGFDYYNHEGLFLDSIGGFPEFTSGKLSDMEKVMFLRHDFATNMTDRIFLSYSFTDLIEVYDFHGKCIKRMQGPHQHQLIMNLRSTGEYVSAGLVSDKTYKCYSRPVYAGEEVFVLYFGELADSYESRNYKIIVFNWDGKPLRMYELDTHLFAFTVDYKNRIIYGITNSPEYMIIKFDY